MHSPPFSITVVQRALSTMRTHIPSLTTEERSFTVHQLRAASIHTFLVVETITGLFPEALREGVRAAIHVLVDAALADNSLLHNSLLPRLVHVFEPPEAQPPDEAGGQGLQPPDPAGGAEEELEPLPLDMLPTRPPTEVLVSDSEDPGEVSVLTIASAGSSTAAPSLLESSLLQSNAINSFEADSQSASGRQQGSTNGNSAHNTRKAPGNAPGNPPGKRGLGSEPSCDGGGKKRAL